MKTSGYASCYAYGMSHAKIRHFDGRFHLRLSDASGKMKSCFDFSIIVGFSTQTKFSLAQARGKSLDFQLSLGNLCRKDTI